MENTKTQTLIERFNTVEERTNNKGEKSTHYPQRWRMKYELGKLLSNEIGAPYLLKYDNGQEQLNEYKENFEWDTKYAVSVDWEICAPSFTKEYECSSVEQMKSYLYGREELEEPDWEEDKVDCGMEYGSSEFTGEKEVHAKVRISNFRLKKAKHEYCVALVLKSEEEEDTDTLTNHLNRLFAYSAHNLELVSITPNT